MANILQQANVIPPQHVESGPAQVGSKCEALMQVDHVPAASVTFKVQEFTQENHVETEKGIDETGKGTPSSAASAICQEPFLDDDTLKGLDKSARFLYNILLTVEESIEVDNLEIIFGSVSEARTWLLKEDVIDVFRNDSLSITILQVLCMACVQRMKDFMNTRFTFLDPFTCSDTLMDKDLKRMTDYLYSSFNQESLDANYCAAFNKDLLCCQFCGARLLTGALNLHLLEQSKGKGQKKMSKFNFKLLQSPKQEGDSAYGYYVMRAMFDVTTKFANEDTMPEMLHQSAPHPYPAIEIEEAKGVLVDYIKNYLC